MLYLGRKSYEEHRVTAGGAAVGEHLEFLNLSDRVADDLVEVLHRCEFKEGPYYGAFEAGDRWVRHLGEAEWVPTLLRRVSGWEGLALPRSPEMDVTRPAAKMAAEAVLAEGIEDLLGEPEG